MWEIRVAAIHTHDRRTCVYAEIISLFNVFRNAPILVEEREHERLFQANEPEEGRKKKPTLIQCNDAGRVQTIKSYKYVS